MTLSIAGEMVEIGRIEPLSDSDLRNGFVLKMADGRYISVVGLTEDECRQVANHFLEQCVITIGGIER